MTTKEKLAQLEKLDDLTIPFCAGSHWREAPSGPVGIKYTCGLEIVGEQVLKMDVGTTSAINSVHQRHHAREHESGEWTVNFTYHDDGTTSLRCCRRENSR